MADYQKTSNEELCAKCMYIVPFDCNKETDLEKMGKCPYFRLNCAFNSLIDKLDKYENKENTEE